jgi:hypothetical protein
MLEPPDWSDYSPDTLKHWLDSLPPEILVSAYKRHIGRMAIGRGGGKPLSCGHTRFHKDCTPCKRKAYRERKQKEAEGL